MTRKLTINENFIPPISDEDNEFFANGIFEFSITKLLALIKANPHHFPIGDVSVRTLFEGDGKHLDEEDIKQADLTAPILLAEIRAAFFNIIDGNDRVAKARRIKQETISAYRIGQEFHTNFLTSVKAYKIHVEYWNEKLPEK